MLGFQYGLMIDEGRATRSPDQVFDVNGVRLFVDPISLRYLKGAEVDFVDNNMGGGSRSRTRTPSPRADAGLRLMSEHRADSHRNGVRREAPAGGRPALLQA
jgi:Fe-S cluster assembly iron-binding protein IscA